jgi:hypothetical protein
MEARKEGKEGRKEIRDLFGGRFEYRSDAERTLPLSLEEDPHCPRPTEKI